MIQRIQSIFLLLASGSIFSLFIEQMSFFSVDGDKAEMQSQTQSMLADGIFDVYDHTIILSLVGLAGVLALVSIFLFKNRSLQMTLTRVFVVLTILLAVLVGVFFYMDYDKMNNGAYLIEVGYGVLSPLLGLIFGILAMRYIKKDEKLVKSMDRLR